MSENELIDLTMQLHHRTEKAILVSSDGDEEKAVWLPLSQIEIEMKDKAKSIVVVTCPAWLATDKDLI